MLARREAHLLAANTCRDARWCYQ